METKARLRRQGIVQGALAAVVLPVVLSCALAPPAVAQEAAGAFGKGSKHFFIAGGSGYAFDENYFVVGLGFSYYVANGLGLGLSFESWTGSDPGITKITPSVTYVFHQSPKVKPYVGGFYRRTNIDGLPHLDSVGFRVGAYFAAGRNAYFGIGGVHESYLDCKTTIYRDCDGQYPELSLSFAF